jgi:hypothetical protein
LAPAMTMDDDDMEFSGELKRDARSGIIAPTRPARQCTQSDWHHSRAILVRGAALTRLARLVSKAAGA